ncbi:hypothetical protein NL108_005072 [Boleophthalmus pectinirostris]|uniref:uncharacterized protein LOC110172650 n=1 Tax=Boleophthalmus pectinirostris TaxID=150288 RepID=UPI000A1C34B3|nr:uncharacterized protein LOC110172650 [Boleophthalmus pectinirostris]KAJ0050669.1 hypothetical protein NL108_005072 [Boleophthalmus pectinirostris]
MRLLLTAVSILSLLYVGHTAPTTNCESLTQQINIERDLLLGKWMYIAETTTMPGITELTKTFVESVYVNVIPLPDDRSLEFKQTQRTLGSCLTISSTIRLENNTMTITKPTKATDVLLTTSCPDCLVVKGNFSLGTSYYDTLQLLSRRRTLSTAELDEFKRQAECLSLKEPAIMDPQKELCAEKTLTDSTDLTAMMNSEVGSQLLGVLDSIINSQGGLTGFMNNIFENLPMPNGD